jgi:hypothetical protein
VCDGGYLLTYIPRRAKVHVCLAMLGLKSPARVWLRLIPSTEIAPMVILCWTGLLVAHSGTRRKGDHTIGSHLWQLPSKRPARNGPILGMNGVLPVHCVASLSLPTISGFASSR